MYIDNKNFLQAIFFGIITVVIGLIISELFSSMQPELDEKCKEWNKYHVMELSLFTVGVTLRMLLQIDSIRPYLFDE